MPPRSTLRLRLWRLSFLWYQQLPEFSDSFSMLSRFYPDWIAALLRLNLDRIAAKSCYAGTWDNVFVTRKMSIQNT
jgi:hypothetical protein